VILIALLVFIAVVGTIVYRLADRYLIEHVERIVAEEPAPSSTASEATANATFDDWNYRSDAATVSIRKLQRGSGSDLVTYFVADVQVSEPSNLLAAFADNAFGRNITERTSEIASDHDAIFAINGDYYGFRSDGVIIRNGTLYRDDPARDAFALLKDGTMKSYDETELASSDLLAEGALNTFSFGPVLVKDGQVAGDFEHVEIDTNFGNRSIQNANPRTGIGMVAPNHYLFIVVDGRSDNYSRGMTLLEFANLFSELGATEAYNLDGGGSSTMYFMGRVVNNPLGKQKERGVSDILYIRE
jgi:exopolysaccharide biosynthesis protein